MKYFCVDIGSTYIKLITADPSAGVLSSRRIPAPEREGSGRVFEISAEKYLDIIYEGLDSVMKDHPDIGAMLLSTQMHGFVRQGRYVSWQDASCLDIDEKTGKTYLDELRTMIPSAVMERTGTSLKPSLGLCNLYARMRKAAAWDAKDEIFTLGSWIIFKMTGRNVCHISNAASLGLASLETGTWDRDIPELAGLKGIRLPKIAENDFSSCGSFERNGQKILVFPDYGDQQVSVFGTHAVSRDVVVNAATAAQVIAVSDERAGTDCENRPYFEGKYLRVITNLPSGRNLQVVISFIRQAVCLITGSDIADDDVWRSLDISGGSDGLKVDPRFFPDQGSEDGGVISGITRENFTPGSLMNALLFSVAKIYKEAAAKLTDISRAEKIICIGGVARKNPFIVRTLGELTGKPCVLPDTEDEIVSGFLRIAKKCDELCEE